MPLWASIAVGGFLALLGLCVIIAGVMMLGDYRGDGVFSRKE